MCVCSCVFAGNGLHNKRFNSSYDNIPAYMRGASRQGWGVGVGGKDRLYFGRSKIMAMVGLRYLLGTTSACRLVTPVVALFLLLFSLFGRWGGAVSVFFCRGHPRPFACAGLFSRLFHCRDGSSQLNTRLALYRV